MLNIFTLGIPTIREIALEYASGNFSLKELSGRHNLSRSSIRKILDEAIIFCVVSKDTALKMKLVAHCNQVGHFPDKYTSDNVRTKSDVYYENLFKKRADFNSWLIEEVAQLEREIEQLNFQVFSYEDFHSSDEWDENPIYEIERRLENDQSDLEFLGNFEVD